MSCLAELLKVDMEINVPLVVPADLRPFDPAAHDHLLGFDARGIVHIAREIISSC